MVSLFKRRVFLSPGKCSYAECNTDEWTQWSASCGSITRTRKINQVMNEVLRQSCDGLLQVCPKSVESENKEVPCEFSIYNLLILNFV